MASIECTGVSGLKISWEIDGFENPFNEDYYICAGVTENKFTVGGTTSISGSVDEQDAAVSGSTKNFASGKFTVDDYGTYTFYGYAQASNGKYYPCGSFTVTLEKPVNVDKWDWSISNYNATRIQTKNAYTAITNKQQVLNFSYLVWNDMVDKVLEIYDEAGSSWTTSSGKYLTSSATKMTSTNRILTADRFNSLRYNIGIHASTGISDVKKGDIVYGSYFTDLTDAMNAWIGKL